MPHTPGPWKNNCFLVVATNSKGVMSNVYGGKSVCHTGGHGNPSEESEANAVLIASSPDMLEVLKELLGMLDSLPKQHANKPSRVMSGDEIGDILGEFTDIIDTKVRAVVAKAEGTQ